MSLPLSLCASRQTWSRQPMPLSTAAAAASKLSVKVEARRTGPGLASAANGGFANAATRPTRGLSPASRGVRAGGSARYALL